MQATRPRLPRRARSRYRPSQHPSGDSALTTGLPFDDFRSLLARLPAADEAAASRSRSRRASLGAAGKGLGTLADLSDWISAWTARPVLQRPLVALFAGTHGVQPDGGETAAFVEHCAAGGTVVSQVCGAHDLGFKVFDLALDVPTEDFTAGPAFDERGCAATMAFGMESIAGGFDLVSLSGFGTGGNVAANAVIAALGHEIAIDQRARAALDLNGAGNLRDPFEVVRRVGGREIAAIMGAILASRMEKVVVLLEGNAAIAAAAALNAASPQALDHCRLASSTGDLHWDTVAAKLGLEPIGHWDAAQPGVTAALGAAFAKTVSQALDGARPLAGALPV